MKKRELDERDLRSLRVFCAAAQANGFAAAERVLSMSKASISRHVNEIEERLGVKLCDRGPGGFQLTESGAAALRITLDALDALERIKPEVDAVRGVLSGPLALGMSEHVMTHRDCRIAESLAELKHQAPLVRPTLSVMTFGDLTEALLSRRVQIAVRGVYKRERELKHIRLFDETHRFYYAPEALGRSLEAHEARLLPLAYRSHPFVEDALATHGYEQGPDVSGLEAVALMIASGHFTGLLPEQYAEQLAPRYRFQVVPGAPAYTIPFCAIFEASRPLTRSAEMFLDVLARHHAGSVHVLGPTA